MGLRAWIDVLTPKQIRFFKPLIKIFQRNKISTFVTTRKYRELNKLFILSNLEAKIYGEHGGGSLKNKLSSSMKRSLNLMKDISTRSFDFTVSFSSVEAARVSFGLSIPHFCVSDSPHAVATSKLTIPLSTLLFSPKVIPKKAWINYGIKPEKIISYNALDPVAWIKDFNPDRRVLDELNLNSSEPIITVRLDESQASYLLFRKNIESPIFQFLKAISKSKEALQIIVLPRYYDQIIDLKEKFSYDNRIKILSEPVDSPSLISFSNLFIGAGGTMTAEAALQGIPTISCFPANPTYVEKYLLKKKLIIRTTDPFEIKKISLKILGGETHHVLKERADRLLKDMENPLEIICSEILRNF